MISRTWSRTPLALMLAVAILSTYSMVGLAAQGQTGPSGDLSVVGQVTVNGANAISGATVFTDSAIATAQGSSAVVSLGKLGRVELLPNSSIKLNFTEAGVSASLAAGRVRFSTPSGVTASVTTKDGMAMADVAQPNVFTVDVECGNTVVNTQTGRVELRAGNTVKQITAGNQDMAGQAAPGTRCTRLTRGDTLTGIGGGALAALLLAVGGAVAAAIIAARDSDDFATGGAPIVISPSS